MFVSFNQDVDEIFEDLVSSFIQKQVSLEYGSKSEPLLLFSSLVCVNLHFFIKSFHLESDFKF